MSKKQKVIVAVASIIAIGCFAYFTLFALRPLLYFIGVTSPKLPDYEKVEKYYEENISDLELVSTRLLEMEYDNVVFDETDDGSIMFDFTINNRWDRSLCDDLELSKSIERLYHNNISPIKKYNGKFIIFICQSSMTETRGIVYSGSGELPNLEGIIELKELSNSNWYYYVNSYEKWQMLNK